MHRAFIFVPHCYVHGCFVLLCVIHATALVNSLSAAVLPASLVKGLDLELVLMDVGMHCGTYRGRQALLHHCSSSTSFTKIPVVTSSKRRFYYKSNNDVILSPLAQSASQVKANYALVQEAQDLIRTHHDWPPMYGEGGPADTKNGAVETDDDEWLWKSGGNDPRTDPTTTDSILTLLDIWQAEQVVKRILDVFAWMDEHPLFCSDDVTEAMLSSLSNLHEDLRGAVRVQRIQSIDPRSAVQVSLNEDRFPVLGLLRKRGGTKTISEQALVAEKKQELQDELSRAILRCSYEIDRALRILGRLDVTFAKAAFGLEHQAYIANVPSGDGSFNVPGFCHPLVRKEAVVPIDLFLGGNNTRALVISGPNGGGKSLALKSFGLAAVLRKLGIPFGKGSVPFYDEIFLSLGDPQDIQAEQSTFTAKLQQCSTMLERIRESEGEKRFLILWDELLSGTDDSAGASIGQAMLEEVLQHDNCHIVSTTHSPRLKELSFSDPLIGCAAVQLQGSQPSFRLEYGIIGQSVAYSALSRVKPPFADAFLARVATNTGSSANDEVAGSSQKASYVHALTLSLERQLDRAAAAADDATQVRSAMMQLARSYGNHLSRLEQTLQTTYATLRERQREDEIDNFELLGDTIAEVVAARKTMKTETELLRSRGLKRLPEDHFLQAGDSVVVIDESTPWHGMTGLVEAVSDTEIRVQFAGEPWDEFYLQEKEGFGMRKAMGFRRYQLAVWDYDCVWDDAEFVPASSIKKSRRDVHQLLAKLSTGTNKPQKESTKEKTRPFLSSRERKASKRRNRKR